jgi:single-strand DNA-binding protein
MFQRVTIIGNLGNDPETRAMPSGDLVCNFSVATNRKWTNQNGTPGEETVWWRVSAWGRTGEICQQYLSKGRQVFIEGTILPDNTTGGPRIWTDQSGQPRASFELRANTVQFLGGRDTNGAHDSDYDHGMSYSQPAARQSAPAQQQRGASAPQQRSGQQRPAERPQVLSGGRRSTMSQPNTSAEDFGDEDRFDPDEIPF